MILVTIVTLLTRGQTNEYDGIDGTHHEVWIEMASEAPGASHDGMWITLGETARLVGVDRSTLSKQARAGRVRCVRVGLGRGQLVVSPAEVLRLAGLYRRVPMKEVQSKLAHELAVKTHQSDEAISQTLARLDILEVVAAARTRRKEAEDVTGSFQPWTDEPSESLVATTSASAPTTSIYLGRLRPRRVADTDLPSVDLLRALDLRRPRPPEPRIVGSPPATLDFGKLWPGRRT